MALTATDYSRRRRASARQRHPPAGCLLLCAACPPSPPRKTALPRASSTARRRRASPRPPPARGTSRSARRRRSRPSPPFPPRGPSLTSACSLACIMRASGGSTHGACRPHFSSTRAVSARMEGGPRACGVAADRWWYCRGGEQCASEPSVRGVARCGRPWQEITFTVTVDRSERSSRCMSAQPVPRVRRIDLIKICLLCYRTRCMECGPGGYVHSNSLPAAGARPPSPRSGVAESPAASRRPRQRRSYLGEVPPATWLCSSNRPSACWRQHLARELREPQATPGGWRLAAASAPTPYNQRWYLRA
jgi:hypothetical protein